MCEIRVEQDNINQEKTDQKVSLFSVESDNGAGMNTTSASEKNKNKYVMSSSEEEEEATSGAKRRENKKAVKEGQVECTEKRSRGRPRKNPENNSSCNDQLSSSNENSGDTGVNIGQSKKKAQYIKQHIEDRNGTFTFKEDPDQYRKARKRQQNRESAVRSRMKKGQALDELELIVRDLQEELAAKDTANTELLRQNEYFKKLFANQGTSASESESSKTQPTTPASTPSYENIKIVDPQELQQPAYSNQNLIAQEIAADPIMLEDMFQKGNTIPQKNYLKRVKRGESEELIEENPILASINKQNSMSKQSSMVISSRLSEEQEELRSAFSGNPFAGSSDSRNNESNHEPVSEDSFYMQRTSKYRSGDGYDSDNFGVIRQSSVFFSLAIVFCLLCVFSNGNMIFGAPSQGSDVMGPFRPPFIMNKPYNPGAGLKSVEDGQTETYENVEVEPFTLEENFKIMIQAAGRILLSLYFHSYAKYFFFALSTLCLFEWWRPTLFVQSASRRSKSRRSSREKHSHRGSKKSSSEKCE